MATFDTLIRGGTIVDGSRRPRYIGDVGIKDGYIAQIAQPGTLKPGDAAKTLRCQRSGGCSGVHRSPHPL